MAGWGRGLGRESRTNDLVTDQTAIEGSEKLRHETASVLMIYFLINRNFINQ